MPWSPSRSPRSRLSRRCARSTGVCACEGLSGASLHMNCHRSAVQDLALVLDQGLGRAGAWWHGRCVARCMLRVRRHPGDHNTAFRPPFKSSASNPKATALARDPSTARQVGVPPRPGVDGLIHTRLVRRLAVVLAVACGDYGGGKPSQGEQYCRSHPESSDCRHDRCANGDLGSCREACELGVTYGCQRLSWDCEHRESEYCPADAGAS
jgi:hypothetical protein